MSTDDLAAIEEFVWEDDKDAIAMRLWLADRALHRAEERIAKARAAATFLGSTGTGVLAALDGDPAVRIDEVSLG